MLIDLVVGCRPNFVKAAAIIEAAKRFPKIHIRLLYTSQHGKAIADPLFKDLELPKPDMTFSLDNNLYGIHVRMARMIADLSLWMGTAERPDYVMVVGDTDSTLAGALAAKKNNLTLVHVEAGLRSEDAVQEDLNRRMVDSVSDIMYTTTLRARTQLVLENRPGWNCVFVGNVMADTLMRFIRKAKTLYPQYRTKNYGLLTLHRAENVYSQNRMHEIMQALVEVSKDTPLMFPMHPRHHMKIECDRITQTNEMGYLEFLSATANARFVITDSGGVQEETTILGVPCITLRDSTERPETLAGSNILVGTNGGAIVDAARNSTMRATGSVPDLWDGHAAERILKDLSERL